MLTGTAPNTPKEFADTIPVADTAGHWNRHGRRPPKRNRKWEKLHRPYRYVNVPVELREQVLALAEHLAVTADEVARAFFEYGIECVDAEILQLHAQPNPLGRKMTLFPKGRPGTHSPFSGLPLRARPWPRQKTGSHNIANSSCPSMSRCHAAMRPPG